MRFSSYVVLPVAGLLGACEVFFPIVEGTDAGVVDAAELDATDGGVTDSGGGDVSDATAEGRVQDNNTIFCGPTLECSHANPNTGCCVTSGDSGSPPTSYVYTCEDKSLCVAGDAGGGPLIACDQGSDCPGSQNVCCWPNYPYPIHTFCLLADASNCFIELCDPNDPVPCVNHAGDKCVPTGTNVPNGKTTPLGYSVCVP